MASLKEQAAHCIINSTTIAANPNDHKFYGGGGGGGGGDSHSFSQDVQSWLQSSQNPQFEANLNMENVSYYAGGGMNLHNPNVKYENSSFVEENHSFGSFDSLEMQSNEEGQWPFQDDADDLQSVAFRYIQHS